MFPPAPSRLSDEEYIEKVRKSLLFWERFRYWAFPVQLGILLMCLLLRGWGLHVLLGFMAGPGPAGVPQGIWQGFTFGAVIGSVFAFMFGKIMHGFTDLRPGFRTERLLLEYHDRLVGTTGLDDEAPSPDHDGRRRNA